MLAGEQGTYLLLVVVLVLVIEDANRERGRFRFTKIDVPSVVEISQA
jgi:hypothetical protein